MSGGTREGRQSAGEMAISAERATRPQPSIVVIFGASGDLTRRKLIPALLTLDRNGLLPERFAVVGASRTPMDDEAFRAHVAPEERDGAWERFARRLHYQPLVYDDDASYRALAERLRALDGRYGTEGNRLLYLALPPGLYGPVATQLTAAGLSREGDQGRGWARLVIEKPFGHDLASARELGETLARGFGEHQIFRIDHYMAKETVQNILMFRFANAIFEPLWNRRYIDHVRIVATERLGVEHRAGYYEPAGVLRDMFQNHMMQLLALVAAEPPARMSAERVRDEKAKLFSSLSPFAVEDPYRELVLGQYGPGEVDGRAVPAYREEPGVAPDSLTPTYAALSAHVDNWRWQGVPFYLVSGKRMARKETRIDLQFKEVPHALTRDLVGPGLGANRLTLSVYPEEEIRLEVQAKRPGDRLAPRRVTLHFDYADGAAGEAVDAYEKSMLDAMRGDQTLFWREDGLEETWAYFDPVIAACETCGTRDSHLHRYAAGGHGPAEVFERFPALRQYLPRG